MSDRDLFKAIVGNCGNSLDTCQPKETAFNADIAGIGVLVSFYFSALAVFLVVIWGYLTATLPWSLLHATDQHVIMLLQSPFNGNKHRESAETTTLVRSPKHQSRSNVLVKFIKMLSDQQLITGLAILIAALSSRCVISLAEWHIVTSLAYLTAATHSPSLDVLRTHLVQYKWVRYLRVTFTLAFLVLFTFTFLADHLKLSIWDTNWIVQCALAMWIASPELLDGFNLNLLILVPVLIILWGKYISAITRLAAPEDGCNRHVTATLMDRTSVRLWSWAKSLSRSESARLVADARSYYDTKIMPLKDQARVSVWYFLEQCQEAYLSEIPVWVFQLVYGTKKAVGSVTNVYESKEIWVLGFGQVVAIGLLVLPLVGLTDIINEQNVLDNYQSSQNQELPHRITITNESAPSQAVPEPLAQAIDYAQNDNSDQSECVEDQIPHRAARKVAILSLVFCVLATVVMVTAALMDDWYLLPGVVAAWLLLKLVIVLNRQIEQTWYIWKEIRSRKIRNANPQSPPVGHDTSSNSAQHTSSNESTPSSLPRLPSLDISESQRNSAHTTATETSPTFERPRRQDTEANLGLSALLHRQDESSGC